MQPGAARRSRPRGSQAPPRFSGEAGDVEDIAADKRGKGRDDAMNVTVSDSEYDAPAMEESAEHAEEWSASDGSAAAGQAVQPAPERITLPAERRRHILSRHRHGAGWIGRTEFPANWSAEKIASTVVDVARHPDIAPVLQDNGRWQVSGVREGVTVVAIIDPDGRIWTGYPRSGGPGVVKNR